MLERKPFAKLALHIFLVLLFSAILRLTRRKVANVLANYYWSGDAKCRQYIGGIFRQQERGSVKFISINCAQYYVLKAT